MLFLWEYGFDDEKKSTTNDEDPATEHPSGGDYIP